MMVGPLVARRDPAAPIVMDERGGISSARAWATIRALASRLPAAGTPLPVMVACEQRSSFAFAALAVWSRGHVVVAPPNLRPGTLEEIAHVAEIRARLLDDDVAAATGPTEGAAIETLHDGLPEERTLAIAFTSGSTGDPNAAIKTAGQLVGEAAMLSRTFGVTAHDRVLGTVPPYHLYGLLFTLLVPLGVGATIVDGSPLHAEAIAEAVRTRAASVLVTAPAHLRALESLPPAALAGLRRVFSSGAALPQATAAVAKARCEVPVTEVLGSTETGGIAWRDRDDGDEPPWQPLPGIVVTADPDGRMRVDSPLLAPGLARPHAADDRIALVDGGFVHLGRIDDVVKIAGKRVSIAAVERRLAGLPGVREAAVLAEPTADGRGHRLVAAVAPADLDPVALRRALGRWFDAATLPRRIATVATLPRESSGKLVRERMLGLVHDEPDVEIGEPIMAVGARSCAVDVEVPVDLPLFAGHFPGSPILPGATQLDSIVLRVIQMAWPDLPALHEIVRLKFTRPVLPGDRLRLQLDRNGERVTFELRRGDEACSSGTLVFSAHPPYDTRQI